MTTPAKAPSQLPAVQQPQQRKALEILAASMSLDPSKLLSTLKATVFRDAKSEEELVALVVVANQYGLNPFLNEIYAFPGKRGGIVPIVGVDGWNKMMQRQAEFDGIEFEFEKAAPVEGQKERPYSCTATIYIKGREHPVKVTEFYDECFRPTDPWKNMPFRMLRHKALIQGARLAFGFSGLYDDDEGRDAIAVETTVTPVSPPKFLTPPPRQEKPAEPTPPEVKPQEQDSGSQLSPWDKIAELCKRDNVSDEQVLVVAKERKLAGAKVEQTAQMTEANAAKVVESWDALLPEIREVQI